MGQCVCKPKHFKKHLDQNFYKSKNGDLSATFNILDGDLHWELLNVNMATEEELMTLHGINRMIAKNIVDYRQAIGGFKKVEDLALVSGVGASKLEMFRAEICINSRRNMQDSCCPSHSNSMESLPTFDNYSSSLRPSPSKLVNLNTANMFNLMSLRGLSQEMAANIVHYRERKGPFKTVDEVLKVKGITAQNISNVKHNLTLEIVAQTLPQNGSFSNNNSALKIPSSHHRRTKSAPIMHHNCAHKPTGSYDPTLQFYKLLTPYSSRPIHAKQYHNMNHGKAAFRVATWNVDQLTFEKISNPGVREVICRTLLENGLSLVALQEVEKEALDIIVSELNCPQLPAVQNWRSNSKRWKTSTSIVNKEKKLVNGFVYDFAQGLELQSLVSSTQEENYTIGFFKIGTLQFLMFVLNLSGVPLTLIDQKFKGVKHILVSAQMNFLKDLEPPSVYGFTPVKESPTLGSTEFWVSKELAKFVTGDHDLVVEGLSHLAIPNGWKWGGKVSSQGPSWIEVTIQPLQPLQNGSCHT